MLFDFNSSDIPEIIYDVCIIGSGPAGTTLANKLLEGKKKILLIEAGNEEINHQKQDYYLTKSLFDNKETEHDFHETSADRLSCIGGTSQHWSGSCNIFEKNHFLGRDWVPNSTWPINFNDLKEYYIEAQNYLELSPTNKLVYGMDLFQSEFFIDKNPSSFNFKDFDFSFEKKSGFIKEDGFINWDGPVRFKNIINGKFKKNSRIDLFYNAYLTKINLDNNKNKIQNLTIENDLKTKKTIIKSKYYCLCCGGLENAKILLNHNVQNFSSEYVRNSLVGKYFLNHPWGDFGSIYMYNNNDALKLTEIFKSNKYLKNQVRAIFYLNNEIQKKENILNHCIFVDSNYDIDSGVYAARKIRNSINRKRIPDNIIKLFFSILKDIDDVAYQSYREFKDLGVIMPVKNTIDLKAVFEQCPNPNSKIELTNEKDLFENYNVLINWNLNDIDIKTPVIVSEYIAKELKKNNLGRLKAPIWVNDNNNPVGDRTGTAHYSGMTRMSDSKKKGVVDKNLLHHDLSNLYISSSSVFPTDSFVNPTFTIIALSLRLADKILRDLK